MTISDALLEPIVEKSPTTLYSMKLVGSDSASYSIFASGCQRPWLLAVAQQLQELLQWEENWDSYGGARLQAKSVLSPVLSILDHLLEDQNSPPSLGLTPAGGIQLEWLSDTMALDIEVEPNQRFSVFLSNRTSGVELEFESTDVSSLVARVRAATPDWP